MELGVDLSQLKAMVYFSRYAAHRPLPPGQQAKQTVPINQLIIPPCPSLLMKIL